MCCGGVLGPPAPEGAAPAVPTPACPLCRGHTGCFAPRLHEGIGPSARAASAGGPHGGRGCPRGLCWRGHGCPQRAARGDWRNGAPPLPRRCRRPQERWGGGRPAPPAHSKAAAARPRRGCRPMRRVGLPAPARPFFARWPSALGGRAPLWRDPGLEPCSSAVSAVLPAGHVGALGVRSARVTQSAALVPWGRARCPGCQCAVCYVQTDRHGDASPEGDAGA